MQKKEGTLYNIWCDEQKAQSATSITNVNVSRYAVMQNPRHPEPNAQLVGAQVGCAISAEHRKSVDQAKGTYISNPVREYFCNRQLGI